VADVRQHDDVRRHAAFLSQGVGRFLVVVQMALGSIDGALKSGQLGVAAVQGRLVVFECTAVRGVPRGGELTWPPDSVSFDPFRLATEAELDEISRLLADTVLLARGEHADVDAWHADIRRYAADTEAMLEIEGGLPILRSADGMYGALGLAQGAFEVLDDLALPSPLPAAWAEGGDGRRS
jgi:hypothetical protein